MKEIYTLQSLDEFFDEFKNLTVSYKIDQVHQLLYNPNAKATLKVKSYYKLLKPIIMTSTFIIGISAILLWVTSKEPANKHSIKENHAININYSKKDEEQKIKPSNSTSNKVEEKSHIKEAEPLSNDFKATSTDEKNTKESISIVNTNKIDSRPVKNSNWPSDTTIDKNSLVIQLSNDELLQLGIIFKNDTLIILKDTITNRGTYNYLSSFYRKKYKPAECDIIPVYISTSIREHVMITRSTGLYDVSDTLLPLVIKDFGFVLWYNGTPDFFNLLPNRFKHLEVVTNNLKQLKTKSPNRSLVNYNPTINDYNNNKIAALRLSKDFFEKMGIMIDDTMFLMVYREYGINFTRIRIRNGIRNAIYMNPDLYYKFPKFNPVFITDELGNIEYKLYEGDSALNYNVIVPVLVDYKELINIKLSGYVTEQIFWYYPNENFIAALPDEIRTEFTLECDNILKNVSTNSSSCTYFEVCRSTLHFDNFNMYPNPAKHAVTVDFEINQEMEGAISLIGMSGSKLKILVPNTHFLPGRNSYLLNLSGITAGIYLISINTDKGFKTQRLIVTQ
jgi:hypothetical protein